MADAVARTGKIQPVLFANRLNVPVIVGVFKPGLQGVVINIRHRPLGLDTRHTHRFKLQIGHRTGRVLGQRLIDLQADFAARPRHVPADQMGTNQLVCNRLSHGMDHSSRLSLLLCRIVFILSIAKPTKAKAAKAHILPALPHRCGRGGASLPIFPLFSYGRLTFFLSSYTMVL